MPGGNPEEEYFMNLLFSQLISDGSGPTLLKSIMVKHNLDFLRSLPFRPEHPFRLARLYSRARRRLEAFLKTFLSYQNQLDLIDRVKIIDELFSDMLSVTLNNPNAADQYSKYRVFLSNQGTFPLRSIHAGISDHHKNQN